MSPGEPRHPDTTSADDRCGTDVAAYALGALDPDEVAAFERHLRACAVCPVELGAFQQVVDELAVSPPRLPAPPSLRRSVLRAVADEPRLDPTAHRGRRHTRDWLTMPRFEPAFAAGLAVVIAAVLVAVFALPGSSGPRHRTIAARVTGQGAATLQLTGDRGQLVVHHFRPPPHGKIYEVWLKRGAKAVTPTTALFSVTGRGDGDVDVPGSLKGVTQVLVTPEPAGGSQTPTHTPVISATL